jgi:DNA-binding MarR family transcriptional regulator
MKARDEAMQLDHQICFALYRASRAMTRAYAPLLNPLGLTYPQYLTLLALWEEDGASMKRLGERLTLDSATLTPLLKRLEAEGIVERRRDVEDERVVRIHLTKSGRALQAKARRVPEAMGCKLGDTEDVAVLKKLAKLRQELNDLTAQLDAAE